MEYCIHFSTLPFFLRRRLQSKSLKRVEIKIVSDLKINYIILGKMEGTEKNGEGKSRVHGTARKFTASSRHSGTLL